MQVLEDHQGRALLGDALEEAAPGPEQLLTVAGCSVQADQVTQFRLDPATFVGIDHETLEAGRQLGACGLRVVGFRDPCPRAHHLGQGPEGDPIAVGRAPALVPQESLGQSINVLLQFPHNSRLADPRDAADVKQSGAALAAGGVQQLLRQSQVLVTANECRLGCGSATGAPTAFADHPERQPRRHPFRLPLQNQWFRPARQAIDADTERWVPPRSDTAPGAAADCSRAAVLTMSPVTKPSSTALRTATASPVWTPARACSATPRDDPSAPTRSMISSADRTARSASSSWATGVPQTAMTASPMNFSTVAAMTFHGVGGGLEVPGEHRPNVLGVTALGERRVANKVDEEHRHQPPLGVRVPR